VKLNNFARELDEAVPLVAEIAAGVSYATYVAKVVYEVVRWMKRVDFEHKNVDLVSDFIQDIILKIQRDKLKVLNFDQTTASIIAKKHKEFGKEIKNYLNAEEGHKLHYLSRMARYLLAMNRPDRQEVLSLVKGEAQ
jgi:hypothetical protein